jgi:L-threonylcarbamoyladenylate synthase
MAPAQLRQALQIFTEATPARTKAATALAVYSRTVSVPPALLQRTMPMDAAAAAHELFSALRHLDEQGATLIWVEAPPDEAPWEGVRDRLRRAAASSP